MTTPTQSACPAMTAAIAIHAAYTHEDAINESLVGVDPEDLEEICELPSQLFMEEICSHTSARFDHAYAALSFAIPKTLGGALAQMNAASFQRIRAQESAEGPLDVWQKGLLRQATRMETRALNYVSQTPLSQDESEAIQCCAGQSSTLVTTGSPEAAGLVRAYINHHSGESVRFAEPTAAETTCDAAKIGVRLAALRKNVASFERALMEHKEALSRGSIEHCNAWLFAESVSEHLHDEIEFATAELSFAECSSHAGAVHMLFAAMAVRNEERDDTRIALAIERLEITASRFLRDQKDPLIDGLTSPYTVAGKMRDIYPHDPEALPALKAALLTLAA